MELLGIARKSNYHVVSISIHFIDETQQGIIL